MLENKVSELLAEVFSLKENSIQQNKYNRELTDSNSALTKKVQGLEQELHSL